MTRTIKLIKYWKNSSDKDFNSAKAIYENTKEYVNVLFLIHLSIEKCLKCYYVNLFQTDAPFTHNLLQLSSKCNLNLDSFQISFLTELNEYNIRSRYPDEDFEIYKLASKAKVYKLIQLAGDFRKWIFQKLN